MHLKTVSFFTLCFALGCGDDASPSDGGTDVSFDSFDSSVTFVSQGALGGDGTRSQPYGSIDEALAADATVLHLLPGEHAPPSAILGDVEIRSDDPETTAITASLGDCLEVEGASLEEGATEVVTHDVVLATSGVVRIESVALLGCPVGLWARGGNVHLENVIVDRVSACAVSEGATLEVSSSALFPGSMLMPPAGGGRYGAVSFGGQLTIRSTSSETSAGVHVRSTDTAVVIEDTTLTGGWVGILSSGESVTVHGDTRISGLRALDADTFAGSSVRDAVLVADGLQVMDSDGFGLVVDSGTNATLSNLTLNSDFGLWALDTTRLEGSNEIQLRANALFESGIVVTESGNLTIADGLQSNATPDGAHIQLLGADARIEIAEGAVVELDGGVFGLGVSDDARATLRGSTRIVGAGTGAFASVGGFVDASNVTVEGGVIGMSAVSAGTVMLGDSQLRSQTYALGIDVGGTMEADGVTVEDAIVAGAFHYGDAFIVRNSTFRNGARGIVAEEDITVDTVTVEGSSGTGLEVLDGANAGVAGSNFRANTGAAIAFYDAAGTVMGNTFGGTVANDDGQAHEVRIVGAGTTREVTVGSNNFDLDVVRSCVECAIMIADGAGAVGIAIPNCLVERPAEAGTYTVVDQNGGLIMLSGAPAWVGFLSGPGTGLGFGVGVPSSLSRLPIPSMPSLPPR